MADPIKYLEERRADSEKEYEANLKAMQEIHKACTEAVAKSKELQQRNDSLSGEIRGLNMAINILINHNRSF